MNISSGNYKSDCLFFLQERLRGLDAYLCRAFMLHYRFFPGHVQFKLGPNCYRYNIVGKYAVAFL